MFCSGGVFDSSQWLLKPFTEKICLELFTDSFSNPFCRSSICDDTLEWVIESFIQLVHLSRLKQVLVFSILICVFINLLWNSRFVSIQASYSTVRVRALFIYSMLSVLCRVCHVFPPLVSIFGLFPVLVWCDYWLILVQPCLSNCLWLSLVY